MLTHRRRTANLKGTNIIQFSASENNDHYGDNVWVLESELPEVSDAVVAFAAEFFGVDEDEARHLCNPKDIVGDAGAWDDAQFVSDLYQALEPVGFRTPDGAVVLDRESVTITKIA